MSNPNYTNTFYYFFSTGAQTFAAITGIIFVMIQLRLSAMASATKEAKVKLVEKFHKQYSGGPSLLDVIEKTNIDEAKKKVMEQIQYLKGEVNKTENEGNGLPQTAAQSEQKKNRINVLNQTIAMAELSITNIDKSVLSYKKAKNASLGIAITGIIFSSAFIIPILFIEEHSSLYLQLRWVGIIAVVVFAALCIYFVRKVIKEI